MSASAMQRGHKNGDAQEKRSGREIRSHTQGRSQKFILGGYNFFTVRYYGPIY